MKRPIVALFLATVFGASSIPAEDSIFTLRAETSKNSKSAERNPVQLRLASLGEETPPEADDTLSTLLRRQNAKIHQLEGELHRLGTRVGNQPVAEVVDDEPLIDNSTYNGLYYVHEFLLFEPFHSQGTQGQARFGTGTDLSNRLNLGWVGENGLGVRARYWEFDNRAVSFINTTQRIHLIETDAEVTDRFNLGQWILTGAFGYRQISYRDDFFNAGGANVVHNQFNGQGFVTGLDLVRPIWGGWSVYGNAKFSALFGRGANSFLGPGYLVSHQVRTISEMGAGLQYNYLLDNKVNVFARAGFEAQYWTDFGTNFNNPNTANISFAGITTSVGISF